MLKKMTNLKNTFYEDIEIQEVIIYHTVIIFLEDGNKNRAEIFNIH